MTGPAAPGAEVTQGRRAAVVVLGDLGRSPRMQYHALALANEGFSVDLIGYGGRPADDEVAHHPRVRIHELPQPWRRRVPRALWAPVAAADVVAQAAALARLLMILPRPDVLLTQNPPSFPTLAVARAVARLRGTRWIVDWHNFGADMLALRLGPAHPAVRLARALERTLAAAAEGHLCVSAAMRDVLDARWGIAEACVLRDRPAKRVGRTPPDQRARLFARYGIAVDALAGDRPAVIVTSSSWTADEDFSLLLDAMVVCEATLARGGAPAPGLFFLMTGDGPQRVQWEQRFASRAFQHVRTKTVWVDAADYPRLLGAADLGVSLHRSASGVDLPMKIADMFGAGLPVCALDYGPVLSELVRAGENGALFSTGQQLAQQLLSTLAGFPGAKRLEALRGGVERLAGESWAEGWRREARALLLGTEDVGDRAVGGEVVDQEVAGPSAS